VRRSSVRSQVIGVLAAVLVGACSPAPPTTSGASPTGPPSIGPSGSCPVTLPLPASPGEERPFGSGSNAYGNNELWVVSLSPDGVLRAAEGWGSVKGDGSIGVKFGWWRLTSGTLTITGRRLDGDAPPLQASIPDGYGSSGFQATGVTFPTEGCWAISGAVGDATLTFVALVLRS
jgi:hypothetical protein